MGGGTSIEYTVAVTEKKQGESQIFRFPEFKDGLLDGPAPDIKTIKEAMIHSFKQYGGSNMLGKIVREDDKEHIDYLSYHQAKEAAVSLASGIIHEKLFSQPEGERLKFVGLFSRNRPEWSIVDLACLLYGMTTVPIYDTLGDENISYVFNHTNLTTVFVNDISVRALMKTQDMGKVTTIISFDSFTEQQKAHFSERGITIRSYAEILTIGVQNKKDYNSEEFKVEPNDCITFSYTSGTTGPPKGAMLSHKNFSSFLAAIKFNEVVNFGPNDNCLSYLPLPHVLERELLYGMFANGGSVVFYSGDVQKIKDDLALVKPTIFVSVPRLFSRFHDVIKKKFDDLKGWTKTAVEHGLSKKLNNVAKNGGYTHKIYDPLFFNKTKAALGGRVRLMISGSAPLLPEVHKFMKVVMCAPLIEGYGQTESTGASFITNSMDPQVGHIGGPVSSIEYKLVDIPEMKYTSDDKDEDGNPRPRGEIWMRGPGVFLGYYKNQEKTKQALTEDGWLKSGDVGAIMPKTHCLKIIDRKKNIFKLQQGEYVAAERVEGAYMDYDGLAEVFLHGESTETFTICIAVPQKSKIQQLAKDHNIEGEFEELCKNPKIKAAFLNEMNVIGKKKGLKGFEQARNIYLEPKSFQQKEIVTNTMKIQRHEAKNVYADEIKGMYSEGMLPADKEKKQG